MGAVGNDKSSQRSQQNIQGENMMRNHDVGAEPPVVASDLKTSIDSVSTDRRTMMGVTAGGLVSALLGMTTTSAQATSGIGLVGSAQAQCRKLPEQIGRA